MMKQPDCLPFSTRMPVVALAMALLLSVSASAEWLYDSAATTITDGNWTLRVSEVDAAKGTLTLGTGTSANNGYVSGSGTLHLGDAVVDVDGVPCRITAMAQRVFQSCPAITNIVLPSGLAEIANYAFRDNTAIRTACIDSASLTRIGVDAFIRCKALEAVDLEAPNLRVIDNYAFNSCGAMTSSVSRIIWPGVTHIGGYAFSSCKKMTGGFTITNLVDIGEKSAFNDCAKIVSIDIKAPALERLPDHSFIRNSSLRHFKADWPNLRNMVSYCFMASPITNRIEDIVPPGVTNFGNDVFSSCPNIVGELVLTNVWKIGSLAFHQCKFRRVHLQGPLAEIPSQCFAHNTALKECILDLPELVSIKGYAFGVWNGTSPMTNLVIRSRHPIVIENNDSFNASTALRSVTFQGPASAVDSLDRLLLRQSAVDGNHACTIFASRNQPGWRENAATPSAAESPHLPLRCLGVYREFSRKAWIVHEKSPFDDAGSVLVVR